MASKKQDKPQIVAIANRFNGDSKWFFVSGGEDVVASQAYPSLKQARLAIKVLKKRLDDDHLILPQTSPSTGKYSFAIVQTGGVVYGQSIPRDTAEQRDDDIEAYRQALEAYDVSDLSHPDEGK